MDNSEKYINPFTDFGFKRLFGTDFNKELLIDFLNQVLEGRELIQDLTYLNPENLGKTEADRKAVFDLYCENERGEKFIIELQNVRQEFFKDRSIFYGTFPLQQQAPKGKNWDYSLKAVYTIGILNFSFPDQPGLERYRREVQLVDTQTHQVFYDRLTFIYLEMPRFRKEEPELETPFDKWMFVLKNLPRLQERPRRLQERVFERLFREAEIAKLNREDMNAYEQSLKIYRDNKNALDYMKKEGREEGRQEGRAKGRAEGKAEGKIEALLAVAKGMKEQGIDLNAILKITGLTKEQIDQL